MRLFPTTIRRYACLTLCLAAAGCAGESGPDLADLPPPSVTVSYPLERDVQDFSEFTGRTAAVESVKVRARVFGHLQKINFTEGAEVKTGDLLFVIDPRPYKAALARAEADLAQGQARVARLKSDSARARTLIEKDAISREEFEKIHSDLTEAEAVARSAAATLETARLNLAYTEVRAPVDGRISRKYVTVGNLIETGEMGGGSLLTTIVSIAPMYVYFDVDDQTAPKIKAVVDGHAGREGPPVHMAIGDERNFRRGAIDFVDNQVDAGTGTMRMRGVFANKDRLLVPGQFAQFRVPLGDPHRAILVTEHTIDTDQGLKVLYVLSGANVVEKRSVRLGRQHDSLREILDGIKVGERVVVDGIHRLRPGGTVEPKLVEMPIHPGVRAGVGEARKTP